MARRNIAEVLTGAVVLLVAAGFLAYAVAHSGRSTRLRLHALCQIRPHRRAGGRRRCAPRRREGRQRRPAERIDPKSYQAVVA